MSMITIKNEKLSVVISSKGAEIQSIKDAQGVEYIWEGNPAFWEGHAPILFPVAGALREECYELDGTRYSMPKHGFARKAEFQVENVQENQATFLFQDKHDGFPFEYDLRAIFTLKDNQLKVDYAVSSRDEKPFYFSVGAHEAYATPEGIDAYTVEFDEVETLIHTNIDHTTDVLAENTKSLVLDKELFVRNPSLILHSVKSRGVTLIGCGRKIRVDFPQHDVLLFWTATPDAPYICIEPWCNAPDFNDADYRIDHKPHFMRIEKGQTITRTHTLTIG